MKEQLDLVKILKDCPKGMELDCTMYDNVTLKSVSLGTEDYPIRIEMKCGFSTKLTKYGQNVCIDDAKCVIFPKGKKTWEGFQRPFIDEDIIVDKQGSIAIYKQIHKSYEEPCVDFHCRIYHGNKNLFHTNFIKGSLEHCGEINSARFATEEEKAELFNAIKANGYRWNDKTKTLEKLIVPKFKVGDEIRHKLTGNVYKVLSVLSNGCGGGVYDVSVTNEIGKSIDVKEQDDYELVTNKFDITTLKPFDKVLVRDNNTSIWINAFFGFYDIEITKKYPFVASAINWTQCIPYEGNEHLLGTNEDCDEYYKNWEE